jgi:hypothetical protein
MINDLKVDLNLDFYMLFSILTYLIIINKLKLLISRRVNAKPQILTAIR